MDTVESGTKSKDAWVNAIASRCSYSFIDSKLSIRQRATAPPIRTSCRLLSVCQFSNPLRGHFSRACGLATVVSDRGCGLEQSGSGPFACPLQFAGEGTRRRRIKRGQFFRTEAFGAEAFGAE